MSVSELGVRPSREMQSVTAQTVRVSAMRAAGQAELGGDGVDGGGGAVGGGVVVDEAADLEEGFLRVYGEADEAGVVVQGAGDGLADPPVAVGAEGVAARGVEEFDAAD
jgi:hypothetical protein